MNTNIPSVDLSAPERQILAAYAAAVEPLDRYDIVESLLPPEPTIGWGGSGRQEFRSWLARRERLHETVVSLLAAGLLAESPNGPDGTEVITDAGRAAIATTVDTSKERS